MATALHSAAQACICEQFLSSPADHVAVRQGCSLLILQLNYRKACRHAREVLAELLRNCGHRTDFKKKKIITTQQNKKSPSEFGLVVAPKATNNHFLHVQKQADGFKSSVFTHSPAFVGSMKPEMPQASEKRTKTTQKDSLSCCLDECQHEDGHLQHAASSGQCIPGGFLQLNPTCRQTLTRSNRH